MHGAELKAQVIAVCRAPGASVSAVALAHGLNANLARKWLVGRGLKCNGLPTPVRVRAARTRPTTTPAAASTPLNFVPIDLAADVAAAGTPVDTTPDAALRVDASIHSEAFRGELHLQVHWPASHADAGATMLRELLALPR